MITAEKVYKDILKMPVPEREKLFATIARKGSSGRKASEAAYQHLGFRVQGKLFR